MKRPAIRVGTKVEFKSWLFKAPYEQYFSKYKGHTFKVIEISQKHYYLECLSDTLITCEGCFHIDGIKLLKTNKE